MKKIPTVHDLINQKEEEKSKVFNLNKVLFNFQWGWKNLNFQRTQIFSKNISNSYNIKLETKFFVKGENQITVGDIVSLEI